MIAYIAVLAWRFSFIGDWRSYYYRFDTRATGLIAGIILHFTLPKLALRPAHAYLATALFVLLAMSAQINMAKLFIRSEEHTSELQSLMRLSYAVFCLKKNNYTSYTKSYTVNREATHT